MSLRERLMDPHGYDKPLFPKAITELSHAEQWQELTDVSRALRVNVWQTTAQMEEVKQRKQNLTNSIAAHIAKQMNEEHANG